MKRAILFLVTLVFLFTSCQSGVSNGNDPQGSTTKSRGILTTQKAAEPTLNPKTGSGSQATPKPGEGKEPRSFQSGKGNGLKVYFLDVGQADSILITTDGASMLIDAGNNADGAGVVDYLKDKGIKKLEYVIGTHPHEDHIGGLDNVIDSFQVGKVIMPDAENDTKTYRDVIAAENQKNLTTTFPKVGATYTLKQARFEILSPDSNYSEANENSIVIRLVYYSESFLFCGDADIINEAAMVNSGKDLQSDVIKIGHHGSATSSTASFLKVVSPEYAVISVGQGNTYGHPTQTALSSIAQVGAKLYRTDKDGTVIFKTDGKTMSVSEENTTIDGSGNASGGSSESSSSGGSSGSSTSGGSGHAYVPPASGSGNSDSSVGKGTIVYVTTTGAKYHRAGCQFLSKSKIPISLSDAKKSYTPCSRCKPPT